MSSEHIPQSVIVLISGRGSNMRALVEHSTAPRAAYRVSLVLSDQLNAKGIEIARDLGIETRALAPYNAEDRASYGRRLAEVIDAESPSLIVLAGFMRILSPEFVDRYAGRILNIHPSLLPKFPGLHTHRNALAAAAPVHGATVHFVTAELDGGPRIIQASVPVQPDDDESTLAARVQTVEHQIYPRAVDWYCQGRLSCRNGQAWLDGVALEDPVQHAAVAPGRER